MNVQKTEKKNNIKVHENNAIGAYSYARFLFVLTNARCFYVILFFEAFLPSPPLDLLSGNVV